MSQRTTFELLSHRYRRYVLHYLTTQSNGVTNRSELAGVVSEWTDADTDSSGVPPDRVAIELHHIHLPKLADANVLDYDDRTGFVRYWGEPRIEAFTSRVVTVDDVPPLTVDR